MGPVRLQQPFSITRTTKIQYFSPDLKEIFVNSPNYTYEQDKRNF